MVFSSIPAYLDPSNWQQQFNQQPGGSNGSPNPPAAPAAVTGSVRPGSMSDRARMANLPMPEPGLKCPRCESTNTKFCYFNNYSLSQPRHFCKTCRRYWTCGGALRNVPVGGGCRRNKRSKGSGSSKSSGPTGGISTVGAAASSTTAAASILGLTPPQIAPLHFMSPLSQLSDYPSGELGIHYGGLSGPSLAITDVGLSGGVGFSSGVEPWRLQAGQISSVSGLDYPAGLYPFHGGAEASGFSREGSQVRPKLAPLGFTQPGSLKMEENQGLNSSRQQLGMPGNDQYWGSTSWTEMSGFSSSSTSNPL